MTTEKEFSEAILLVIVIKTATPMMFLSRMMFRERLKVPY